MNILFLWGNPVARTLGDWLEAQGNRVIFESERISVETIALHRVDLVVSYSYRYILKEDVIHAVHGNIVNLHISYLPWNRGACPNQWSFLENTPKGVTIHFLDTGLDSGDIIAQRIVNMEDTISLKDSYALLNKQIVELFKEIYPLYPFWHEMKKKALGKGSYHSVKDFEPYNALIGGNYDMSAREFCERARNISGNKNESLGENTP